MFQNQIRYAQIKSKVHFDIDQKIVLLYKNGKMSNKSGLVHEIYWNIPISNQSGFFIFGSIFPQKVLKKKLLETYRKFENETFWKCAAIVFVIRSVLKSLKLGSSSFDI